MNVIEVKAQKALSVKSINNYIIGFADGKSIGTFGPSLLACAILELARHGANRLNLGDQMWALWTDGHNSVAVSTTIGSSQSKSAGRTLRRVVRPWTDRTAANITAVQTWTTPKTA